MKRLLASLASVVLISSTVVSSTAWTSRQATQQQSKQTANETATDIANKLEGKTVNLNLKNWKGKKVMDNIPQFRDDLVQQGLLTEDEAQYVYNGNVKWTVTKAGSFPGCVFLVKKDGQTASAGDITLNIYQDTAQSIADKLAGKTLNLDLKNWYNKNIADNPDALADLLVQQKLLTADEVSYVSWNPLTITTAKTYTATFSVAKDGAIVTGKTMQLNVTSSEETAGDIAQKLKGKGLPLSWGKWKDRDVANFTQKLDELLVQQGILNQQEVKYVLWPHFAVDEPGNFQIPLTVQKFGETAHVYDFTLNIKRSFLPDDKFNFVKDYDNQIFVGTAEGLYVSSDNGHTWVKNYYLHKFNVTKIWFVNPVTYLVEIQNGTGTPTIYSTTDDGKHFGVAMQHETVNSVQVLHNISSKIKDFVSINTTAGIIDSFDGGKHWKINKYFATMNVKQVVLLNSKVGSQAVKKLGVVTDNSGFWISGPNTTDPTFDSWTKVGVGALTSVYQVGNVTYLLSYKYGMWINNDSVTTSTFTRNSSLKAVDIKNITVFDNKVYAATTQGLWYSSDQGATWKVGFSPAGETNYDVSFLKNAYGHLWVYSKDIGLWESFQTASGTTSFRVNQTVVGEPTSLARASNGLIILGTKSNGIYESSDSGQTFYPNISAEDLTGVTGGIEVINRTIYVGGSNGLYMSEDNGKTFYHED